MTEIITSDLFADVTVSICHGRDGKTRASDGTYTNIAQAQQKLQIREVFSAQKAIKRLFDCFTSAELAEIRKIVYTDVIYQYKDLLARAIREDRLTWCPVCDGRGCDNCEGYGFYPTWWDQSQQLIAALAADPRLDRESDIYWASIPDTTSAIDAYLMLESWAKSRGVRI